MKPSPFFRLSSVLCLLSSVLCLPPALLAQKTKPEVTAQIDANRQTYEDLALKIWSYAEVGYKETQSSALYQSALRSAGFTVQMGVADMPTAFVASYGQGSPVIGILAEYDALPGVSQAAVPARQERPEVKAGHACGHNLLGIGGFEAAAAVKAWLIARGQGGTVRLYGCPAEEGGAGKVYLVRAGLFNDVDAVIHWHPSDANNVLMGGTLANKSAKFRFHGIASHAAAAPERGRSALDGVEAFDYMTNMMREHIPDSTRMHYVITHGGEAPNVVPAFAEVYYYLRSPSRAIVQEVWARMEDAARGAALGTGTKVDWEIIHGAYEMLPNEALGRVMQANFEQVGGATYDDTEKAFAEKLGHTLPGSRAGAFEVAALVQPFNPNQPVLPGSTDVGDISWQVPTVGINVATWVPGTPGHSWQSAACSGMSIGLKGMQVAAKTMALTAIDLYQQPALLAQAKAELLRRRGPDFNYNALVGDRKPPLDYRN